MAKDRKPRKRLPKQGAFLAAYAKVGNISRAAQLAKVHRDEHYHWLKTDPTYEAKFDAAHEDACEALETEARRRAVEGVRKPVYQGGKKVGTVQEYSDVLLIFLMKGAMPEKYRERQSIEHSGQINTTIAVVEDPDWYGNAAQVLAAQGIAPPDSSFALTGPHEVIDLRTPLGEDGSGIAGDDSRARADAGST